MGIPIIPEPEYEVGIPCRRCDSILWKPDKTPLYVDVIFTGMLPCFTIPPEPPNGVVFKLVQWTSCSWYALHSGPYYWEVTWSLMEGASGLNLSGYIPDWGRYNFFTGWEPTECLKSFSNILHCPGAGAEGGRGVVTFFTPPPPPVELLNITPAEDLFYEEFETPEPPKTLYKFCQRSMPMNVLVLYEPPE